MIQNGIAVQSFQFREHLPIGRPDIAVKYLAEWGADEIIILDLEATKSGKSPNLRIIEDCANAASVPLTVGGGIRTLNDAQRILNSGADKISINSGAGNPLLSQISSVFGAQAIVVSVDYKKVEKEFVVFDYQSQQTREISVIDFVKTLDQNLFGEILIQSSDRDGSGRGFDIDFLRKIESDIDKPVIAAGGFGMPMHLDELFSETDISAGAIGNSLHHFEHALIVLKSNLNGSYRTRFETDATYVNLHIDKIARVLKRDDSFLNELLYKKIPRETI